MSARIYGSIVAGEINDQLTRCLKSTTSSSVKVSDFAMTGIKLTLVCNRRINSTSIGLSLGLDYISLRPRRLTHGL